VQKVNVIIGLNENPNYFSILPVTVAAYRKFFPEARVIIGLISDNDSFRMKLLNIAKPDFIYRFDPIKGIDTGNQAKIIRYFLACNYGNSICVMNDVDIIPLCRKYFEKRLSRRVRENLLTVGSEWYGNGKFPTPWCTGEGYLFSQFVNPLYFEWEQFITWTGNVSKIDGKESISLPFGKFSDESLIRSMLNRRPVPVINLKKYPKNKIPIYAVSRHHAVNVKRLHAGKYIEGHHLFPFNKYGHLLMEIVKYIGCDFDPEWYK